MDHELYSAIFRLSECGFDGFLRSLEFRDAIEESLDFVVVVEQWIFYNIR